jgi:hypothetical protein
MELLSPLEPPEPGVAQYYDIVAAAYAEVGDFDRAVSYGRQAADLAARQGAAAPMLEDLRARLALYEARRAFRLPVAEDSATGGGD